MISVGAAAGWHPTAIKRKNAPTSKVTIFIEYFPIMFSRSCYLLFDDLESQNKMILPILSMGCKEYGRNVPRIFNHRRNGDRCTW
jgi:hypothetical protein